MKVREKQSRVLFAVLMVLYTVYAILLFWFHPFVASAKEPVPGGKGNTIKVSSLIYIDVNKTQKQSYEVTMTAKSGYEIVGYVSEATNEKGIVYYNISYVYVDESRKDYFSLSYGTPLADYAGYTAVYHGDKLYSSSALSSKYDFMYANGYEENVISFSSSGCKIFNNRDGLLEYCKTGSLDGMIKEPELDKQWYLKHIRFVVKADDSPTSEAGEDATYIKFFWETSNLQEGDLLEIRTHNVLKKIGGDQISGFHDYITRNNNVSAYDNVFNDSEGKERAAYTLGQYDATKAWFSTVENKPLFFKSYETDIYYFRPYRNGKYGGWVKVSMKRATPTSSPFIEKVEVGDLDEDGNWTTDEELTEENGGSYGVNQGGEIFYPDIDNPFEGTNLAGIFKSFYSFMKGLPSLFGELPALVGSIVSFLPSFVIGFIAMGIVIAIILRIVGR